MKRRRHRTSGISVSPDDALCELFDLLPEVQAWIKDARHRYLWVNRAFLLNYGLHRLDEVLGKTDHDLSPPHLAAQFLAGDEAVLAGQTVQGRLELIGRFDHTASWSFTTKRQVRDAKGRAIGTTGITRVLDAAQIDQREDIRLGVVISMMTQRLGRAVTNAEMAKAAGMSSRAFERAFERAFVREYGLPPQQYLKRLRIQTACRLLVDTRESIAAIAQRCGFADQSHLTREFRRVTGSTPSAYRAEYAAANVPSAAASVLSKGKRKR
jgi:AraC-like DNA-binding protein